MGLRQCQTRELYLELPDGLAQYVLNIIRERYTDFGPTLACEKLAELHDVHLSKETVRSLMVKAGLWIPRKQRAPKIQQPRYRRACCGELIQIDGCDHHWFENRAPACTALVYVDDATSRLMQLRFVKSESTFTYFEATRGYLEKRRVSKSLTVQYDKVLYLIEDNELSRRAIGKYIEVWHYPDGRKELRRNGVVLPYSTYDRLQEIDQGAIVDNKRLGHTLEFIKLVQDKRDNNRSQALPAGDGSSRRRRKPTEKKSQRSLDGDDMLDALKTLQSRSDEIFGTRK